LGDAAFVCDGERKRSEEKEARRRRGSIEDGEIILVTWSHRQERERECRRRCQHKRGEREIAATATAESERGVPSPLPLPLPRQEREESWRERKI
jgi:hypothetical protein